MEQEREFETGRKNPWNPSIKEDLDELMHIELDDDEDEDEKERKEKRDICFTGCGRPSNVCLCNCLPTQPISTSTQILILHHPHELRHKLATVPILTKCLSNSQTLIGRRLRLGSSRLLDSLYTDSLSSHHRRAIFLFPSSATATTPSIELNRWVSSNQNLDDVVLIVFDGTWNHAKEMLKASLPFLSKFATQVSFHCDADIDGDTTFNSDLVLRKEPSRGCMSTLEAVARSLRLLEHPPSNAIQIEDMLISVLKAMVHFQALHLKPLKSRPNLSNKNNKPNRINHSSPTLP